MSAHAFYLKNKIKINKNKNKNQNGYYKRIKLKRNWRKVKREKEGENLMKEN